MRKRPVRSLLNSIALTAVLVIVSLVCILIARPSGKDTEDTKIDDNVKLTYDVTNTIPETALSFEKIPGTDTCKFIGLATTGMTYTNTLAIPEYATVGSETLRVVEIDTDDSDATVSGTSDQSIYVYGSNITALVIPNSVTKINGGAFYGMASLQYLETPYPDTITSYNNNGVADNYGLQIGIWPIHKLFSKGYMSTNETARFQDSYRIYNATTGDQKLSETIYWYELTSNSKIYFEIPTDLQKIKITNATTLGNRTFIGLGSTNHINLTEVVLPEGLTTVGEYTFAGCDKITAIELPSTLGTLSTGMFSECSSLLEMVLPKTTSIPEDCFGGCTALNKVVMSTSVSTIGSKAFSNCKNLKIYLYSGDDPTDNYDVADRSVILPEGLTSIGSYAFQGCESIVNIIVPDNVTSIGANAFIDCIYLEKITLPFVGSKKGTAVDGNNAIIYNENNFGWIFGESGDQANNYKRTQNNQTYMFPKSLDTIVITGETDLEPMALGNLCCIENAKVKYGVNTISINDACKIQASAFAGSNALTDLTIPHIGAYKYYDTADYKGVGGDYFGEQFQYPANFTDIKYDGADETQKEVNGTKYYIPSKLGNLIVTNQVAFKTGSFKNCISLVHVEIRNTTKFMHNDIFHNNPNLTTLSVPFVGMRRGEFYIWYWYWKDNYNRNTLAWIFSGSQADDHYQDNTIAYGSSYRKYIPNNLTTVEVTNDTEIDYRSFKNLTSIKTLTIKDTTSSGTLIIESGAAEGCTGIETLNLPFIGRDKNAESYDGDSHRLAYIFGTDKSTGYNAYGYYVPSGLKYVSIDFVNKVPANAFRDMSSLNTVIFKTNVTGIGVSAFNGCSHLSNITYTDTTTFKKVDDYGFYGCTKINLIKTAVPAYEEANPELNLGAGAFGKTSISDIDFTKIKHAGNQCFYGCLNITSVNVTPNLVTVGDGLFESCVYLTDVNLAQDKVSRYMFKGCTALEHIDLTTVIVTNHVIPDGMFQNCTSLKWGGTNGNVGVSLNDEVTTIGAYAFYGCSSLTEFVIPPNVTTIGDGAFYGVNGLDSITIPVKTTQIGGEVFTYQIGGDFVIWVYVEKENWPWQEGWNCNNPVRVLPGIDDSMYTFELNNVLKGYVITGFKPEITANSLSGTLVLPRTHDGVKVVGIEPLLLQQQTKITKVVIPSTFKAIRQGALDNGKRVDLYFEHTLAKAPTDYDTIGKTAGSLVYDTNANVRKLTACGLVFFGDQWEYGQAEGTKTVPYLHLSKLTFVPDTTRAIIYDGTAHTPEVLRVELPGLIASNDNVVELTQTIYTTLFTYQYSDNIAAGRANIRVNIDNVNYQAYVTAEGNRAILLTGYNDTKFTINKRELWVGYNSDEVLTTRSVPYSGKEFTIASFNNQNVTGLDTGYEMTGRLSTRSANAGTYIISDEEKNDDFYWDRDWKITYKGKNVTDNFAVKAFYWVDIEPLDVYVYWTDVTTEIVQGQRVTNIVPKTPNGSGQYEYGYTGTNVLPTAHAFKENGDLVEDCTVVVTKVGDNTVIYPGQSGMAQATLSSSSKKNYNFVNFDNINVYTYEEQLDAGYVVVNGKVKITISKTAEGDYVIPYDDDNFSFSNWRDTDFCTVEGLGSGSKLSGEIISQAFGSYAANDKTVYSYTNGGIAWNPQQFNLGTVVYYQSTHTPTLNYLIAKYDDNGNIIEVENDYYDVSIDNVEVYITYNKFKFKYYVGSYELNIREVTEGGVRKYVATYPTDGTEQPIEIHILNASTYNLTYSYDGATTGTSIPMKVKEIGTYTLDTLATRKNFDDEAHRLELTVNKSNVEYKDLSKEYDGLNVDLSTFITKKDQDHEVKYLDSQTFPSGTPLITLTLCNANKVKTTQATEPGTYYVHIVADETPYFNGCDKFVPFTISKRVIHIYVDRVNYLDQTSNLVGSIYWSGNKYCITIDSSTLSPAEKINLVGNDNIYGALWTRSSVPGVYDTEETGDWYWSPAWSVFDGSSGQNKANIYYTVQLHGKIEILHLPMTVVSSGVTVNYDGNFYNITVVVTDPSVGYTIYYTLDEPSPSVNEETLQLEDDIKTWRTTNYTFQSPGRYDVYYKVVYDNYLTEYGHEVIEINYVPITYDDPSVFKLDGNNQIYVDYTTLPIPIKIENVDPTGALVEYSMDDEPFTSNPYSLIEKGNYTIKYRISYPNYETIEGSYSFRITEEFLTALDGYVFADDIDEDYDKTQSRQLTVSVTYPNLSNYKVYFRRVGTNMDWVESLAYSDAGTYNLEYLVVATGFKSYKGTATIKINEIDFVGVDATGYIGDYTGEIHYPTIVGADNYPGIKVLYTTNTDIISSVDDEIGGWTEDPIGYKNVGTYTVYVAFRLKNYKTIIKAVTISISKTHATITYTDDKKVEYLGRAVKLSDLGITTIHDGNTVVKIYEASYSGGTYTITSTTPVDAIELGYYYVTISYGNTDNCFADSIQFGFEIVKRKLVVEFDQEVEYNGSEQHPDPRVDSKTGDILLISYDCYEVTGNPTTIGEYHYKFDFATPQTNYELVHPTGGSIANYPYVFKITPIHLHIEFEDSMAYDYDNQKYWYKDSGWTGDTFDKILNTHQFTATMRTSSYARGTYIYDSSAATQLQNTIIITDAKVIDKVTGNEAIIKDINNQDVNVYEITYKIVVKIVFPELKVTDKTGVIVYDGNDHGLTLEVPDSIRNLTFEYATPDEKEADIWRMQKLTYTNVGEYVIWYKITSPNYEDYIDFGTLKIVPATLAIDIDEFDETYDAYEHYVSFNVTNVVNIPSNDAIVRYYKASDYTQLELEDLYSAIGDDDSIIDEGLTAMIDAGDYYAVVFYAETGNYYNSFTIEQVKLKQRPIRITLNNSYINSFDYNGEKQAITLGAGATYTSSDLVYGHRLVTNIKNAMIQTIDSKAITYYGETDFEFKNDVYKTIIIRDNGGKDVTANYRPSVQNAQLSITINRIPLTKFDVYDVVRDYDGTPARPTIDTPSDGAITYTYYPVIITTDPVTGDVISETIDSNPVSEIDACGFGKYYVSCQIGQGTNYYAWAGGDRGAYVTITAKKVEVVWENLEVTFNGQSQAPRAHIIGVDGEPIEITVEIRYDGDLEPSVLHAGIYEAIASLNDNNYELIGYTKLFTINKLDITLTFEASTDVTDSVWTKSFHTSDFTNLPTVVDLYNASKNGTAKVSTTDKAPGLYNLPSYFVLDYSAWVGTEDVTNSINIIVNGSVTIIANEIIAEVKDNLLEVVYDGYEHSVANLIRIISPVNKQVQILYGTSQQSQFVNVAPSYSEVGDYLVNYQITAGSDDYQPVTGSFTFRIVPKASFINFTSTLNREYNGESVSPSFIKSIISGEYNGSINDLVFTYYSTLSSVPLSSAPMNAGSYRVVITSSADLTTGTKNYTDLLVERLFEITPKTIRLTQTYDYQVSLSTINNGYDSGEITVSNLQGLGSYNVLKYRIKSKYDNLERGLFRINETAYYDAGDDYNQVVFIADCEEAPGCEFEFAWWTTYNNTTPASDSSFNYIVELDISIKIHFPYMVAGIANVTKEYTGSYYYGDDTNAITTPNPVPNDLQKYYGTSAATVTTAYPITYYQQKNPGSYTVFYKFTCSGYEDFESSFTINIGFDERIVTVNTSSLAKVFDGNPTGTLINGYYFPDFTMNWGTSGMSDDYSVNIAGGTATSGITIVYYERGYKTPLNSVTHAGDYEFVLTIPQSTYYKETVIRGESTYFTITRKGIFVDGTYTTGYRAAKINYSDFNTVGSAYTMTYNDGTPIPSTFTFTNLTIETNDASTGLHEAYAEQVYIVKNAIIKDGLTDITNDYQIILYSQGVCNAKINIQKGTISADPNDLTVQYDGAQHTISFKSYVDGTTAQYSEAYAGPYQDAKISKAAVGTYPIYIKLSAPNYNDQIIVATLTITKAETTFDIPSLSKVYDGTTVQLPANYLDWCNNKEVSYSDITNIKYRVWDETIVGTDKWKDLAANAYPKNAGKYLIQITIPSTDNYAGKQFEKEFTITGRATSIRWDQTSFVYDGTEKSPTATFDKVDGDTVNIIYSHTPSNDNYIIDPDHKTVGIYTVSITLQDNSENYLFSDEQKSCVYTITPRPVDITLQKSVTYNNDYYEFTFDNDNYSTSLLTFKAVNIVDGHYVNKSLKTTVKVPGNYDSMDDNFEWIGAGGNEIVILNANDSNNDVTFNYKVNYALALNINFSEIRYTIESYDGEYDGLPHGIKVTILNTFAPGDPEPTITYSLTPNGVYESEPSKFYSTNVVNYKDVYVRIECTGFTSINGANNPDSSIKGTINITKKNAALRLADDYLVFDKYYDGNKVENPVMKFADMDKESTARTLTYTYYKKNTNPNSAKYGQYELVSEARYVGDYKLTVSLNGGDNYDNGEQNYYFVIRKRTVTVTNATSLETRQYNGSIWQLTVTNERVDMMVPGSVTGTGLVPTENFSGILQTKSANVGDYEDQLTDFEWQSSYEITNGTTDVKDNYDVVISMHVKITLAKIEVADANPKTELTYNGKPQTINIVVNKPTHGYTIYYATVNDDSAFTTSPVYLSVVGELPIYYKIVAPNYETFKSSGLVIIKGVVNDGTVVSPSGDIYYGDSYDKPKYTGSSNGTQTVTYYQDNVSIGDTKPTNAGTYKWVLELASDGVYQAETFDGTFTIKPLVINVNWNNTLTQTYDETELKPSPTVNTLETTDLALDFTIGTNNKNTGMINVGKYNVVAEYNNGNYLLANEIQLFEITKREIAVPSIKPDMSFRYQFKVQILDDNGDPVLDANDDPTYYTFGDDIIVRDVDENIYILDENGTILEIRDKDNNVINADPQLQYKILIDSNKNACQTANETRTITVVLNDKANNCWANVSNKNDNQVFDYRIERYSFPDATDGLSIEADTATGESSFEVTGEAIKPAVKVNIIKNSKAIYTFDATDYSLAYENNVEIGVNAKIEVTGLGNYEFEAVIPFKIIKEKSKLLELKAGVIPIFMRVKMETGGITIIETGLEERTEDNKNEFYLGHIHQNTTIDKVLKQFDVNTSYIKVFDKKGVEVAQNRYEYEMIGTGYDIVYYDKDGDEQDRITVIIFGDTDGDGMVTLSDNTIINRMCTANASMSITYENLLNGEVTDANYSYLTVANYFAAVTERTSETGNMVSLAVKTKIYQFTRSNNSIDFNADYEIIS